MARARLGVETRMSLPQTLSVRIAAALVFGERDSTLVKAARCAVLTELLLAGHQKGIETALDGGERRSVRRSVSGAREGRLLRATN